MPDLTINTDVLNSAATNLRKVAREFNAADSRANRIADAVGDDALASAVRDFASSWDDRREKMYEAIGELAEASGAIGENFEEIDYEFGAVLRGER